MTDDEYLRVSHWARATACCPACMIHMHILWTSAETCPVCRANLDPARRVIIELAHVWLRVQKKRRNLA